MLNRRHFEDRFSSADGARWGAGGASNFDQGALANRWMQQLTIGGVKATNEPRQEDASNDITRMCLEAARKFPFNCPTVDLRVHKDTPGRPAGTCRPCPAQRRGAPEWPSTRTTPRRTGCSTPAAAPLPDQVVKLNTARKKGGEAQAGSIRWVRPALLGRVDPPPEYHLVLVKAFRHLAFDLGAWLGQPVVVIAPPLLQPRLVTVGPVGDPMGGDGVEQVVTWLQAAFGVLGRP